MKLQEQTEFNRRMFAEMAKRFDLLESKGKGNITSPESRDENTKDEQNAEIYKITK